MLVLLPPSETKQPGGTNGPVRLPQLSWHRTLGATRRGVLKTLVDLCRSDRAAARAALGLSERLDAERQANARLRASPTLPAGLRYTGVLYDALGYPTLTPGQRQLADASLLTFSGLWGALRPTDLIPSYRLGIGTRLPGQPSIPALWRRPIGQALSREVAAAGALDLRSTGYSQMAAWSPGARTAVVTVRITAHSFGGKQLKGQLVRAMLELGSVGADELVTAAAGLGLRARRDASTITVSGP
jgi:cytoplasmic iron level regulating protein YaaA (DUF328/UPF0246 family)